MAVSGIVLHKVTDKLTGIVKGDFICLLIFCQKLGIMDFPAWHGFTGKNGIVNGITDAGMIGTVQISQIQDFSIFIAQDIHIIFQQDTFIGQCSCFIHTKHIHASKALHGVQIFDDGLFFTHGKASFCKAGGDDHGEHFRHQPYRYRQCECKGFQPFSTCDSQYKKYNGNQNCHKPDHDPGNGIGSFLKSIFIFGIRFGKSSVQRIRSYSQYNAFPFSADNCGRHKRKIFQLCYGFLLFVTKCTAAFFQNGAFSSDSGLGNK